MWRPAAARRATLREPGDRILVFGSFLTVGPALEFLGGILGYSSPMDSRAKQRLTGAVILVALFVLLVPELLTGPRNARGAGYRGRRGHAPLHHRPQRAQPVRNAGRIRSAAPPVDLAATGEPTAAEPEAAGRQVARQARRLS